MRNTLPAIQEEQGQSMSCPVAGLLLLTFSEFFLPMSPEWWCAQRAFLIRLEEGLWVDIFQRRDTDLWPEHLKYTSTASSIPNSPKQAAKSNALASATRRFSGCLLVLCSNSDKEKLSLLFCCGFCCLVLFPLPSYVLSDLDVSALLFWEEKAIWERQDGSLAKDACHQAWWPKFSPWSSHIWKERSESLSLSSDLHTRSLE